jgi:hypothetical protein
MSVTFADVGALALSLPEAEERLARGTLQWRVRKKLFVWERPLRPKEVAELGSLAPGGPVLGARVEHLGAREALLADEPDVFFTTSHFTGHPAVLVRLDRVSRALLEEIVTEAWLARAPAKLVDRFLRERG